jgi:CheY-like chemotaxis protein
MIRPPEDPARHTTSVLVVEDNDDIRFLLRFWFESDDRCGPVWEATSPPEAIEQARTRQLDVILVDYMLTGGTALDCLPELRRLHPQAWIAVFTANRAVAVQAGVLEMGADVLLEKVQVVVEDVVELALSPERPAS